MKCARVVGSALALSLVFAGAARADYLAGELSVAAGFYRLSATQDLGSFDRLHNLRIGVLDETLPAIDLRTSYCPLQRLCLGGLVGVAPGALDGRTSLVVSYRAELAFYLLVGRVMPFVAIGGGGITLLSPQEVLGRDTDPAGAWSAGLKVRMGTQLRLRVDFSHVITDGQRSGEVAHNFSLTMGVAFAFARRRSVTPPSLDGDGDGVPLPADRCPDAAEDPDGFADGDGCPEADNDRDGVADYLDLCPQQPAATPDGCPPRR